MLMDATTTAEPARVTGETAENAPAPWVPVASRHMMNMAILAMLPMIAAGALNYAHTFLVDPDIWWHLADARFLLTQHHFIHTDPYAFTAVGQRWIDWEWLSEIPYWFSYQAFGLRGIYLLAWCALVANILFVYWRGYRMGRSADAALGAAAIGYVLMTVNSGPRMIEFAYLAMSVELAILEAADRGNRKLLWLLPPLFCLWINLHGSWLFGLGLLGLYILCGWFSVNVGAFQQQAFSNAERRQLLAVFFASALAPVINPYGWHLMAQPFDMMFNQKLSVATITEWQPLSLSSTEGYGVVAAIVAMIVANCVRGRVWKVHELAMIIFAWYMAINHHRFTYLAAIVTTPMLARDLSRSFTAGEKDAETIAWMNGIMTACALGVMLFMFPSQASLDKMLHMMFPMKTIAQIQPTWRTFDTDYVGGMMAFESKPSFMDTRFDSFEHLGVMQDSSSIVQSYDALELLDKYRVDHALVKDDQPIAYLLQHTPGWSLTQRENAWEGEYLLFARNPITAPGPPDAGPAVGSPKPNRQL